MTYAIAVLSIQPFKSFGVINFSLSFVFIPPISMAKTSKTVPQKEKASSSRLSGDKAPVEPSTYDYIPGPCVTKDAVLRPSSGEEGTKSPVPKPGKDKKCKAASRSEGPKSETRRVRRKVIALSIDSVQQLREEEEDEEEEEEEGGASALVSRSTITIEVTEAPEPMATVPIEVESGIPSLDRNAPSDSLGTMTMGYSPSPPTFSEEALKEARELKTPDMGGGSRAGDPFRDCFTGVGDASDIGDASLLLEEAQRFITWAISRFRVDLSQCEVELQKVLGERDALRLLCSQKNEAIKDLQADLAKAHEEEAELDKQLRNVKKKSSAQAKRIEDLEAQLAEAKAEVESSKILADKSIAIYRADVEASQMEAREAADTANTRAYWIAELSKSEAEALASDGDDDDDDGSKSGSEGDQED
ncbi:uncharacterized protein [Nicotiana tomentosiformis]|uniref:uncharacterized protein n=1 Tax=Nicotiana tomentosiformis TaxID=4098 RepID=UPI00388C5D7A